MGNIPGPTSFTSVTSKNALSPQGSQKRARYSSKSCHQTKEKAWCGCPKRVPNAKCIQKTSASSEIPASNIHKPDTTGSKNPPHGDDEGMPLAFMAAPDDKGKDSPIHLEIEVASVITAAEMQRGMSQGR
eukprot:1716882-Amphidinium_carterae.3